MILSVVAGRGKPAMALVEPRSRTYYDETFNSSKYIEHLERTPNYRTRPPHISSKHPKGRALSLDDCALLGTLI
jgi:hypothetical protein